jgi:hypothetical protein
VPIDNHLRPHAMRAAARIHEHLLGPGRLALLPRLPSTTWQELSRKVAQFELSCRRGWQAAARSVQVDLSYGVRRLERELQDYQAHLQLPSKIQPVACPRDIAADLAALPDEFDEVAIDLKGRTISAVTDPICLEELELGPFRITLDWARIGLETAYTTRALEPCRPQQDEEITHPHVRCDVLCEGDGAVAIKVALQAGRLLDFFTLVKQILATYNDASAYVAISRWSGILCTSCGHVMSHDRHDICERCEAALCRDCSSQCGGCDTYVCDSCLGECTGCGAGYCRSCLSDRPGSVLLCKSCLENPREEDPDNERFETKPAESAPAAEPLCLGEADVSA